VFFCFFSVKKILMATSKLSAIRVATKNGHVVFDENFKKWIAD
jgi:hypothetical protein